MRFAVKSVEAYGLYNRFDLKVNLRDDINVLYGRNGSGKTTLLHILANILNGSIDRFLYLNFKHIKIVTSENNTIELYQDQTSLPKVLRIHLLFNNKQVHQIEHIISQYRLFESELDDDTMTEYKKSETIQNELKTESPAYFPAFRTMIEAWASSHVGTSISTTGSSTPSNIRRNDPYKLNLLARELFGKFVPDVKYPSLSDTASRIARVVERATYEVARNSQEMLSEAFVEAYRAILSNSPVEDVNDSIDDIVSEIYDLQDKLEKNEILSSHSSQSPSSDVYKRIAQMLTTVEPLGNPAAVRVLSAYRKSLREQNDIQSKIYAPIDKYIDSVNEFLEGKKIAILPQQSPTSRARVALVFENNQTAGLQSLSSGEQQIVSMH
jgi:energy-coupling factor transporter ATP-binding protein EcfA2